MSAHLNTQKMKKNIRHEFDMDFDSPSLKEQDQDIKRLKRCMIWIAVILLCYGITLWHVLMTSN